MLEALDTLPALVLDLLGDLNQEPTILRPQ